MLTGRVVFPDFTGLRCLMMPYVQGDPKSVPDRYAAYSDIIRSVFVRAGDIGYLTIDESIALEGRPHRGERAKTRRALHTEAGLRPKNVHAWGNGDSVTLDDDVVVLLANSVDKSCAIWDAVHHKTSFDGDIGDQSGMYPYESATLMGAGEVHKIGILTPHESLPVRHDVRRQFLRIVSSGVHGRERYFTDNPLIAV